MGEIMPSLLISQDRLNYLIAAMLVYQQYRLTKTPASEERSSTLLVLTFLISKLQSGTEPQEGGRALPLLVDEVHVMTGGLAILIDQLQRKPTSRGRAQEIGRLKEIKTLLEHHFSTTQD